MKKQIRSFLAGFLSCAVVFGLSVSAFAISGRMTLEVDPVNIQVNGEVFAPTDVNGNEVPVFAYEGTTYAPLRALAEAYGLEVGYDAEKNMASVGKTDEVISTAAVTADSTFTWSDNEEEAYEQFKALWDIIPYESVGLGHTIYSGRYNGDLEFEGVVSLLEKLGEPRLDKFSLRLANEIAVEKSVTYNHFLLDMRGKVFYSIITENGTSEIIEKAWIFE